MAVGGAPTLLNIFQQGWQGARERHMERYKGGLGELQKVAGMYGPGYMAGQERLALTGAKSALAARGLGGTTRPQGVSAGMKAGFEDVRRAGKAGAMTNIAQYMGGFQELEASPATLAHLYTGGFSGLLGQQQVDLQRQQLGLQQEQMQRQYPSPGTAGSPLDVFGRPKADTGQQWSGGGGGSTGGTARPSTPGSPMGGYVDAAGAMTGATQQATGAQPGGEFGPPTEYYGGGGGWQNWETTGGKVFGDVGESTMAGGAGTMAGVTAGQTGGEFGGGLGGKFGGTGATGGWDETGGKMSDAELMKRFGVDAKKLNSNIRVGDKQMSFRDYLLGGASHAAFGVEPEASSGVFAKYYRS